MLVCVLTGFSSGLPLYVIFQLIPAWLRTESIGLKEIGFFALVGIPYSWKFIWSPLMDRYSFPLLGHRRGWMLITQLGIAASIAVIGWLDPRDSLWPIAYIALAMAFFSASQDIVLDAFRREYLRDDELATGNSIHVQAYRISGLIPGGLALIMADYMPWQTVFMAVACCMVFGVLLTLSVADTVPAERVPTSLRRAVVDPFRDFIARFGGWVSFEILLFMFFYKLGDNMATALSTTFYIDLGFELKEIGIVAKNAALWPSIIGGMLAIPLMTRWGINRSLWIFGVVQVVSILGFVWLAQAGPDKSVLAIVIAFEYLGVGLGTAAFIAYIAKITSPLFAATQFALLSAVTALPRTVANSTTGIIVEHIGWPSFYWLCALLAVPGMLMLVRIAPWNGGDESRQQIKVSSETAQQ
jgi:PAT family beta-lactamase induction signal transducer AmpG